MNHADALALLTASCRRSPEHENLDRLIGDWEFDSDWYVEPPEPTPLQGRMLNRDLLGGHLVESRCLFEGAERARIIYGYDPAQSRYFAFSMNAAAANGELEFGHYDEDTDALRFSCLEFSGKNHPPVRADRTITFLSVNEHTMCISYPDSQPPQQLAVELRLRRVEGSIR